MNHRIKRGRTISPGYMKMVTRLYRNNTDARVNNREGSNGDFFIYVSSVIFTDTGMNFPDL